MELFDRCNKIMRRNFDKEFSGLEISSMQAAVIQYILIESAKRDVFMKDIEEYLGVRGSSATSLLHTLEKSGYIKRVPSKTDGRYKKIVLTDKSMSFGDQLNERIFAYIDRIFGGVSEEELAVFKKVLEKMMGNM